MPCKYTSYSQSYFMISAPQKMEMLNSSVIKIQSQLEMRTFFVPPSKPRRMNVFCFTSPHSLQKALHSNKKEQLDRGEQSLQTIYVVGH